MQNRSYENGVWFRREFRFNFFFFVQNINDETEIVVEKKVRQREKRKEMGESV